MPEFRLPWRGRKDTSLVKETQPLPSFFQRIQYDESGMAIESRIAVGHGEEFNECGFKVNLFVCDPFRADLRIATATRQVAFQWGIIPIGQFSSNQEFTIGTTANTGALHGAQFVKYQQRDREIIPGVLVCEGSTVVTIFDRMFRFTGTVEGFLRQRQQGS